MDEKAIKKIKSMSKEDAVEYLLSVIQRSFSLSDRITEREIDWFLWEKGCKKYEVMQRQHDKGRLKISEKAKESDRLAKLCNESKSPDEKLRILAKIRKIGTELRDYYAESDRIHKFWEKNNKLVDKYK